MIYGSDVGVHDVYHENQPFIPRIPHQEMVTPRGTTTLSLDSVEDGRRESEVSMVDLRPHVAIHFLQHGIAAWQLRPVLPQRLSVSSCHVWGQWKQSTKSVRP